MLVRRTNILFVTTSILWNSILILHMPISLVTSSLSEEIETTITTKTKTKTKFSNDPRIELENDITTGEKKAAEMLWREEREVDDDHQITSLSSTSSSSSDKLLKKLIMASRQQHQQSGKLRNHYNNYNYINNNHDKNNIIMMIYENEMISQSYGLNSTSVIDRTMISKLENQLLQQKQKQKSSSDGVSGLPDYLLGMIHLYDFLTTTTKKHSFGNDKVQQAQTDEASSHSHSSSRAKAKAIYHLRRSSNQGYVDAQCSLGIFLLLSDEKNEKEAIQYLYKATKQYKKQPRSLLLLGKAIYFHGWTFEEEVEEDIINKKKKNVIKNIKKNEHERHEHHSQQQIKLAIQYFQKAANENVPDAIHQLAILYEYDLIPLTPQQNKHRENAMKKAESLYKKAHLLKFAPSTYHLGLMYAYGRRTHNKSTTTSDSDDSNRVAQDPQIIRQDYAKAIEHFRICAMEFMYAPCFRYLGILAVQGNKISSISDNDGDGPHNQYEEAIIWFDSCVQAEDKTVSDLCQWDMHQIMSVMEKINK